MKLVFTYQTLSFYLITILFSLASTPLVAYFSNRDQNGKVLLLLFSTLVLPCITAIVMIYFSGNKEMIRDFCSRLTLFKIQPIYLAIIVLLMPCITLLATTISLAFGYSTDQFFLSKSFSMMKGWNILGIFVPLVLAPLLEELGWRGYGVDSLRSHFNLFTTSVIFGILWALWHLPLFFVKGAYQNELCQLGTIYVLNFFFSVFVVTFIMNWIFYQTGRSIPALILLHSIINLSSILFRTEPLTKCITTVLLCIVVIFVVMQNKTTFLEKRFNINPRDERFSSTSR